MRRVSCIMPTRGRPEFARRAIELFLAQDYPRKQLIIVDDEDKPSLLPSNGPVPVGPEPEIFYWHIPGGKSIGAKRNIACDIARGDLVAHWDDDDWHSPKRLSTQIAAMEQESAQLCGVDRVIFYRREYRPVANVAFSHDGTSCAAVDAHITATAWLFKSVRVPWLVGGTLVYERELWQKHPFSEVSDGEDTAFVDLAYKEGARVAVMSDPSLYVAFLHDKNTTVRNINSQWMRLDVAIVDGWMQPQRAA